MWSKLKAVRVCTAHDRGQFRQRSVAQLVLGKKRIETATRPVVRKLYPFHVERRCAGLSSPRRNQSRGDEEELRRLVDEAGDQPWAGNAIDLGSFSGNPLHTGSLRRGAENDTVVSPMVKTVSNTSSKWLLFLPQLPSKPDYARVKLWRRLQPLGVVALRAGVYALPNTADAREDLEWVRKEVEAAGGTAVVCEAAFLQGISDAELQVRFREQTNYAYQDVAARARTALGDPVTAPSVARRLRRRLDLEQKRDHFGAASRADAEQALTSLEASLLSALPERVADNAPRGDARPNGAVWVTRAGVFVDRIASAWLIRRFIDRKATFKFVRGPRYAPRANEIRFDMFDGEYTHRGNRCTFETLVQAFGLTNDALAAIAEIVHDIDLKDDKFQRPEADGIAQVLHGLALSQPDDSKRLQAGAQILENLFTQLSASPRG